MTHESLVRLSERCWSAASRLESQIARNPGLPPSYRQFVSEAFESLRDLSEATKDSLGPWKVTGRTEDDRMYCLSNPLGYVVAKVYDRRTAEMLVALSHLLPRSAAPSAGGDPQPDAIRTA